jgi:flagellar biosynthesis component FlhA
MQFKQTRLAMTLFSSSLWIFIILLGLVGLATVFPTPTFIFVAMSATGALILFQAYIILKDQEGPSDASMENQENQSIV